jgi:ureidoglycolate lyase
MIGPVTGPVTGPLPGPKVRCLSPDRQLFAPYGTFVQPPKEPGQRAFYSQHLGDEGLGAPVFHTNHVRPSVLPLRLTRIERHPRADQAFVPLDVGRYVVAVMPSDADGNPLPDQTLAFLVPGSVGVIYRTGVWHLGATVLDRPGSFAVLMRRRGDDTDDEFREISGLVIEDQPQMLRASH